MGFTLVELMVSLAVFSIVMTVSVGTLLVMVDLNAKAQALYSATTNLSFALDSLTREIRTGYRYNCAASNNLPEQNLPQAGTTADCAESDPADERTLIAFRREEDDVNVGYRLNSSGGVLEQKEGGGNWVPITAPDVYVESFEIVVENSSVGNNTQPVVNLKVRGYVENGLDTDTDFFIQTRITQRRLDIL